MWQNFVILNKASEEIKRHRDWGDHNLQTETNNNNDSEGHNITDQSEILCPNASSRDRENLDPKAEKELILEE